MSFRPRRSTLSSPRTRAIESLKAASLRLNEALPRETRTHLSRMDFPVFDDFDSIESKAAKLESVVEELIQAREEMKNDHSRTQLLKDTVRSWFKATYPFVTVLLGAARSQSAVFHCIPI